MGIGPWLWRYPKPIGIGFTTAVLFVLLLFGAASWRGYDRSEFLALGQLVMDVLTFPVTVWGFLFVIHEFRKSEGKPQVDLFFDGNVKETELVQSPGQRDSVAIAIFTPPAKL